jgi:PAS domain S-box-containing protein
MSAMALFESVELHSGDQSVPESELRYRRLFEAAQDGILILDGKTGAIDDANPFLTGLIGYSREELLGKMLWELGAFEDSAALKQALMDLQRLGEVRCEHLHLNRKDGSRLALELVGNAYDIAGNRVYQCSIRDVTERRRIEQALDASELRFRKLIENASDVIGVIRADGTIIYVSPGIFQASGFKPEEVIGRNFFGMVHPDDLALARSDLAELSTRPGELRRLDVRLVHKDGSIRYTESLARDLTTLPGVNGIVVSTRDVTERKRANEALQKSHAILEGILNSISVRVFWKDRNLVYLGCNTEFARDAGFADPKDLVGKDDHQMVWRNQAERYQGDDRQVIDSGRAKMLVEEPQTTPAGAIITLLTSKIPLRGATGEIEGVLGTYLDITQRKHDEEALRATEKRYRDLFESTRDAIVTYELPSLRFVDANAAAVQMFGAKDLADFIAHSFVDASPERQPDGQLSQDKCGEMRAAAMSSGSHLFEWAHCKFDGAVFPAEVLLTKVESGGKVHLHATVRDISERKRAERELSTSAAIMSAIQEASPDGILLVDPQGKVVSYNRRFVEIWAIPPRVVAAGSDEAVLDLVAMRNIDEQGFRERVRQLYADPDATGHEEIRLKDGRTLDRHTLPVKLGDGSYLGRVWFFRDITASRQNREALQTAIERLQAATEGAAAGVWDANLRTRKMSWDATVRRQYAVSADDPAPDIDAWLERVHAEDRAALRTQLQAVAQDRTERLDTEFRVQIADGTTHWLRAFGRIFRDASGAALRATGISLDITEQRLAEAAKRRADERYRLLFKGMSEGFARCRMIYEEGVAKDLVYLEVNEAFERLTGLKNASGSKLSELIPGFADLDPGLLQTYGRVASTGAAEKFDVHLRSLDKWLAISVYCPEKGQFVAVFDDITARKRAEQDLRLFRTLIDRSNDAIEVLEPETMRFLDVNQKACIDLGYSREELLSMSAFDVDPVLKNMEMSLIQRRLRETGTALFEGVHARKDGSSFPVEVSISRVHLDRDYQVASVRDISERRDAAAQLQAITGAAMDAVILVDNEGKLAYWNDAAEHILGYTRADALGKDLHALLAPARYRGAYEKAFELFRTTGQGAAVGKIRELDALRKDGTEVPVELSLTGVQLQGKWNAVGILRDISARKAQERTLARMNRALKTLSACNSVVVHAQSELQLLQEMCRTVVTAGGYRMAWVGLAEHDACRTVRPVASAGSGDEYIQSLNISWAETERGSGPTGRCIRSKSPQSARYIETDPSMSPWRENAIKHGFRSSLALPLMGPDGAFGAMTIYSSEDDSFDSEELLLLSEMAGDLAYGILSLRIAASHAEGLVRLERSMEGTVHALAYTVEARDPYTAGHQRRVADLATAIAQELGRPEPARRGLELAASIHDIGKISVPAEILAKPSKLTPLEFELLKGHAEAGFQILKDVTFPWPVAEIIRQHHERLDGSGYPRGLKGEQILPEAKILAVADVVEAMISHRPYRAAMGLDSAMNEIAKGRGTIYDADIVDACVKLFRERGFRIPD